MFDISQEMFDDTLADLVSEMTGWEILSIPGVYELISEYYNNEVLSMIEENTHTQD